MRPNCTTLTVDDLLTLLDRAYEMGYREGRSQLRQPWTPELFWRRVDKNGPIAPGMNTPCWLWTGGKHRAGYGSISHGSVRDTAHHYAYVITHGPVPKGLVIRHRCHVRACCNPDHLILGTVADNNMDIITSGRPRKATLRPEQIPPIRARLAEGEAMARIARDFGVTYQAIASIRDGKTWRHVA
jgi:hypothetical protein